MPRWSSWNRAKPGRHEMGLILSIFAALGGGVGMAFWLGAVLGAAGADRLDWWLLDRLGVDRDALMAKARQAAESAQRQARKAMPISEKTTATRVSARPRMANEIISSPASRWSENRRTGSTAIANASTGAPIRPKPMILLPSNCCWIGSIAAAMPGIPTL